MSDDDAARRRNLTFAQAEGVEPLPQQLARIDVSSELRARLWEYIYSELDDSSHRDSHGRYLSDNWEEALKHAHVRLLHRPLDEFRGSLSGHIDDLKARFMDLGYLDVYGWLQHMLRRRPTPYFADDIGTILRECRSAYRVIDGDVLVPVGSDTEARVIGAALGDLRGAGLVGGLEHLKQASGELTASHFAPSVRESIQAVESVVRVLEPDGDFSRALAKLEAKTNIHGALKRGFTAIYGFTSDAQGIRHALLEKGAPDVDEADALFMIGACSAFVSYLINKARAAGLLS
jgi:hypothetical protein